MMYVVERTAGTLCRQFRYINGNETFLRHIDSIKCIKQILYEPYPLNILIVVV